MNNCLLLIKIVREGILGICLFPATFVFYQTWKDWFDAFGTGKNFILPIQDNIHELITQECKRNTIHRLLVGLPLRFARRVLLFGCRRAFLSGVGLKYQFKHFPRHRLILCRDFCKIRQRPGNRPTNSLRNFLKKKSLFQSMHTAFSEREVSLKVNELPLSHTGILIILWILMLFISVSISDLLGLKYF